jgi:hypothetical protein
MEIFSNSFIKKISLVIILKIITEKFINVGTGILIQGIIWLIFWLIPAYSLFEADQRWGHNFALPIIFITVGLTHIVKKISCQLIAVFASFFTIPILLAFWPWDLAIMISCIFLIIVIFLSLIERSRETELLNPKARLKAWLKIHLLNFSYFGLAHMPLIFFLVRWFNPDPFLTYLPVEHHASTSTFNAMLLILTPIALMERYVKKIGKIKVSKVGFIWTILMIIIPLLSIAILGD